MPANRRDLPSLTAVRAFEVAARRQSFKAAADELCITPAAVSRQIKLLEESLGACLFQRGHRQVALTAAGERLYRATRHAFDEVTAAARDIRQQQPESYLNLHVTSSFARLWLVPRLTELRHSYPQLHLHLISEDTTPLAADHFDAAITLGWNEQPGYTAIALFSEQIFPVCTPAFLRQFPQAADIHQLVQLPLLDLDPAFWQARWWSAVDWPFWLGHFGIKNQLPPEMRFSHFPMLLDTVLQGLGVGLGWQHLTQDLLDRGELVRPVTESYLASQRQHYFVYRNDLADTPGLLQLRDWLLESTGVFRVS